MAAMVALQFFDVAALGAALLVFGAVVALVMWWREESTRAAHRERARARHTALNAPAAPPRRADAERVKVPA